MRAQANQASKRLSSRPPINSAYCVALTSWLLYLRRFRYQSCIMALHTDARSRALTCLNAPVAIPSWIMSQIMFSISSSMAMASFFLLLGQALGFHEGKIKPGLHQLAKVYMRFYRRKKFVARNRTVLSIGPPSATGQQNTMDLTQAQQVFLTSYK